MFRAANVHVVRNSDCLCLSGNLDGTPIVSGPVDPQMHGVAAHGVVEEFRRASEAMANDPRTIPVWQPMLAKYPIAFVGECEKAIKWSASLLIEWLNRNMLLADENRDEKISTIVNELIDHSLNLAHNRHLSASKCREIGLVVQDLESDEELHDKLLSVHNMFMLTLSRTAACKMIENHNGMAFVQVDGQA